MWSPGGSKLNGQEGKNVCGKFLGECSPHGRDDRDQRHDGKVHAAVELQVQNIHTYIHTYRQTDRQTDKQTDRQTDRHTYIQETRFALLAIPYARADFFADIFHIENGTLFKGHDSSKESAVETGCSDVYDVIYYFIM